MSVEALISLELDQRRMADVVQGLRALPEVLEVKVQAGREDLLVHVAIASLEALQVLTASIVDIDGVRKTTSTFSVCTPIPFRLHPLLDRVTADTGWSIHASVGRLATATRGRRWDPEAARDPGAFSTCFLR